MPSDPEQQRYESLYAKGYPPGNPERLVMWAGAKLEEKVIDLGCGRATLSRIFQRYTGVDFASNAFPARLREHLHQAPLTDLPAELRCQHYGLAVCADVMEHIRPEDIDAMLDSILGIDASRFLFGIACRESNWKDEHGQLHLTVQPPQWWVQKIIERSAKRWRIHATRISPGPTLYIELLR